MLDKFMKQMNGFVASATERADKYDGMAERARGRGDSTTAAQLAGKANAERQRVAQAKQTIAKKKP